MQQEKPESGKVSLRCSRNRLDAIRNRINGKIQGYSNEAEDQILDIVRNGSYDFVWFDEWMYGSTVKKLKHEFPKLPLFVFYHTTARPFLEMMSHIPLSLKYPMRIWDYWLFRRGEKLSALYSDANVILNERDKSIFTQRYGARNILMLPMCLRDTAKIAEVPKNPGEFNLLFVGGGVHKPNVDGIKWFAKNVMPKLDQRAVLHIVGNKMDDFRDAPEFRGNDRIRVTGRVDSLDEFYNMADLVVSPIFYGGGMMTKVAEALMYGKNFLATHHALNGYDGLEHCRCDTAEEFAAKINELIASGVDRYNPELRKIYEQRYSLEAMKNTLREFLTQQHII